MPNFLWVRIQAPRRRLWASIVSGALSVTLLSGLPQAAPAQAAGSLVIVEGASLARTQDGLVVKATIRWNDQGVERFRMDVGDLRLVAISEQGHLPYLLGRSTHQLPRDASREATFIITDAEAIAAARSGNRVVLTATQHAATGHGVLSERSYVTVAEIQPFGSPQPNIGRRDCSAIPIEAGAVLRHCDLVGAFLDSALVSIHDPKAYNCTVPAASSCLERADLTGATAVGSDFSGATIAGGRMNGIDLTDATLDNFSMAGAQARRMIARGATSDRDQRDSAADMFAADLTGADLRETVFLGVSIGNARMDGVRADGAHWALFGLGASLRGATLTGANLEQSTMDWVDFTGARLGGSTLDDRQLAWAYLCRTELPARSQADPSRDCPATVESPLVPIGNPDQDSPYVSVDGSGLREDPDGRTITARVTWDAASGRIYGMSSGTVRAVAVDRNSGVPTLLFQVSTDDVDTPLTIERTVSDGALLSAMRPGNRVVLTATQHEPEPLGSDMRERAYVTATVLQKGPGLGRVGSLDCSRVAISANASRSLDFCDLTAAMLDSTLLRTRSLRESNLTGGTARASRMIALDLGGSRLGGLSAPRAEFTSVSMFGAWAPSFDISHGRILSSALWPKTMDDGNFTGALLNDSPLATASLRRATFTNARLVHPDLAFTSLALARLDGVDATTREPSLFLADLTGADLSGSRWNRDETGQHPARWATLCGSTVPGDFGIDGSRDCPS